MVGRGLDKMDIKYIAHSDDLDFEDKVSSLLLYHKIVSITQVDSMEAILTLDNGIELITIGNSCSLLNFTSTNSLSTR